METSRVRSAQPDLGQDAATAPGFAVLTSAAGGVAVLVCVHCGWAPLLGNATGADQFIGLVIGGIVLSTSLLVWALETLYLVGRSTGDHGRSPPCLRLSSRGWWPGSSLGSTVGGWVYSPGTEPVADNARQFEELSGDWYTFVFSTE
ncbi:hypothetical protein [Nocardia sp. NPDC051463]|uniref:hypothetical protein n=1 Tax=Nocardia sp. NPDC051463 TaxID=3154845 RepID=UPI0034329F02